MRRPLLILVTVTVLFAAAPPAYAAWQWPVSGEVITPYRNGTDPYATGQHRGIDIAAPAGTAVRAAAGGEVRFAGTAGSSGLTVGIRTGDGYDTSYLHLSSLEVRAGAHVSVGERIGAVGTTGSRSAAAPHLHFGVRDAGTRHAYHDPLGFLPPPPTPPRGAEPPPPAPGPEQTAAPPAAAPAPAPAAAPLPQGPRQPAGVRAPRATPEPRAAPVGAGVRIPTGARGGVSAPAVGPASAEAGGRPIAAHDAPGRPAGRRTAHFTGPHTGTHERSKSRAAASRGLPEAGRPAPTSPAHNGRVEAAQRGGPDIGWALACAGLLLAAGILGLTHDGRRTKEHTRTRPSSALRPLAGRR